MTIRLGVVMDPIHAIHYQKDSTLAMLFEAEARHYEIYYFELQDLFLQDGVPFGNARRLHVYQDENKWFSFHEEITLPLDTLQCILMRKDPPFNARYIYATYLLEHAERRGTVVVNAAQSLRDANEKLFATYFPDCMPKTVVTQSKKELFAFWKKYPDMVCKPLDSMGGTSVFRLREHDANANVVFDMLTQNETQFIMAQQFIPEITAGDKRILMINGAPVPFVLARVPQGNDWRGNLAAGAKGKVQPLSARDQFICDQVGPVLKQRKLFFVGLDVIGDYLTEINVTSPTCIREIDASTGLNISAMLFDVIEERIAISSFNSL